MMSLGVSAAENFNQKKVRNILFGIVFPNAPKMQMP